MGPWIKLQIKKSRIDLEDYIISYLDKTARRGSVGIYSYLLPVINPYIIKKA